MSSIEGYVDRESRPIAFIPGAGVSQLAEKTLTIAAADLIQVILYDGRIIVVRQSPFTSLTVSS